MNGQLLINGKWIETSKKLASINPANEKSVGNACLAGKEEVVKAVNAAKKAQTQWKSIGVWERAKILSKIADEVLKREESLKSLITQEMGRPLVESEVEVLETADMIMFFANEGKTYFEGETFPIDPELFPNKISFTISEPIGVIGIIKPWNYPLELPFWSIAPALLAGNTIIFKPSELTPFVGMEIGKICKNAGIPDGVVNILTGDSSTGQHLVQSDIDMISFTGSIETGKKIMKNSAEKLHKISLELGGSDPMIICNDSDFEEALNGALWGRFTNCGQVCVAAKRIFIEKDIAKDFISEFVEKTKGLIIGDGQDPNTDIGPLVSHEQREKLLVQVEDAIRKGAKIECGAKIPSNYNKGFYYEPTVITNVKGNMRIMNEEVFGPVAVISIFSKLEDVIVEANKTKFGLGASIWSKNLDTVFNLTSKLDCGMIWVNEINVAYPQCPWGGVKHSGIGKELSKYGLREFTNIKHINIDYGQEKTRPWWFPYNK